MPSNGCASSLTKLKILCVLFGLSSLAAGQAQARPRIDLSAQVTESGSLPDRIAGEMTINGLANAESCFYLPYLDPEYGNDRGTGRRLEAVASRLGAVVFQGGTMAVQPPPGATLATDGPAYLLRVVNTSPGSPFTLRFTSTVPRLDGSDASDWFYDGFYPQLLERCPEDGSDIALFRTPRSAAYTVQLTLPPAWDYGGLGTLTGQALQARFTGRTYAFSLTRGLKRLALKTGNLDITVLSRTPDIAPLVATLEKTLPHLTSLFGPYPFPSLTVIETTELQRQNLPGIVALNKPAQSVFDHVQRNWLNWQHWMVVSLLGRQWYGAGVVPAAPDDEWLTTGIVEFATLDTLRQDEQRFNLFNTNDEGARWLSFDYLQILEITAASLRRFSPFAVLTAGDFRTRDPQRRQHAMLYVKQAVAMRQAQGFAGEQAYKGFLRNLTTAHLHDGMSPESYRRFLTRLPSPFSPAIRQALEGFLDQWWKTEGWPDFKLVAFTTKDLPDGRYVATVKADQLGAIDFPPIVGVRDEAGTEHFVRASPLTEGDRTYWTAELVTREKPSLAAIDPSHESFDADRFNNTSGWPGLSFFPGGANTLRDDAYTVVWIPYALRRPGEPFTLGLQASGFRYIQGGLHLKGEAAPAERLGAFEIRQRFNAADSAILGDISVDQEYDGSRISEASLVRTPLFVGEPHVSIGLKGRNRQQVGRSRLTHQTGAFTLTLKPAGGGRVCGYNISGEIEKAPRQLADDFSYERRMGQVTGDCALSTRTNLSLRLFGGELTRAGGEVPDSARFRASNLKEAKLRLDKRSLELTEKLTALTTDLTLPLYLPLPSNTLVLSRQLRWRLFYDVGRAHQPRHDYRTSGAGITMPLGGDLSGAGSLALTRLTLLGIFYTNVDGVVSRKPSVVFDLTGEL